MPTANADLRSDLEEIVKQEHIPAVAWVIKRPGEAAVISTIGSNVTEKTPFRFGSITKSFTAIALLKAAESKGLPLSTPLDQVIPAREFSNSFKEPVRLMGLVALTAGHTDIGFDAFNDNTAYPLTDALRGNRDVLASRWPPGLLHSYSNAIPGLSERVIEVLTGKSYASALKDLLFSPLDFNEATFDNVALLPGGFRADGTTAIPYWNMTFKAFGGLNLSM